MTIEQDICSRVSEAVKPLLKGIPVEGNFLGPSGSNPKGAKPYRTALARVEVSPRACAAYTAAVAEVRVSVEASLSLAADPDLSRALAAYCRAREEVRERAATTTTAAARGEPTGHGPTPQGGGQGR